MRYDHEEYFKHTFDERAAIKADRRLNYAGGLTGSGEYVANEIIDNLERKAQGLPEREITAGMYPWDVYRGKYNPDTAPRYRPVTGRWKRFLASFKPEMNWHFPAEKKKPVYTPRWQLWLAKQLAGDWLEEIAKQNEAERDRLHELISQAEGEALTDGLTKLPNRRSFDAELEAHIARCERSRDGLALLYIDLDHFKQVNDTHGHEAGDDLLVKVADALKRATRQGDIVARRGGDEFAILVSGVSSLRDAEATAERILTELDWVGTSASIGIAAPSKPLTAQTLRVLADSALYVAKEQGRGRYFTSMNAGAA